MKYYPTKTVTYLAISRIDKLLESHYNRKLSPEQKFVFSCLWNGKTFSKISQIHGRYTAQHLERIAGSLWELLSFALDESISTHNFKYVLTRRYPELDDRPVPEPLPKPVKPPVTKHPADPFEEDLKRLLSSVEIDDFKAIDDSLSNYSRGWL